MHRQESGLAFDHHAADIGKGFAHERNAAHARRVSRGASERLRPHPLGARPCLAGAAAAEDQPHPPAFAAARRSRRQLIGTRPQRPVRENELELLRVEFTQILAQLPGGARCAQSAR